MEIKSEQSTPTVEEGVTLIVEDEGNPIKEKPLLSVEGDASDIEEAAVAVKAPAAKPRKKVATKAKRKKPAAKSKRPKQAAKPVAKKEPLTADEIRETLTDVKTQIVEVGLEPAREAFSSWSETVRGAVGGFMSGLLGEKEKKK